MRSSRSTFIVVVSLTIAVGITGLGPVVSTRAIAPGAAAESNTPVEPDDELTRPDRVSAVVTARASGVRVEDLSLRTETTQVFANPDGTVTVETASGPEFVQDDEGEWHDVDTTLVERDGLIVPSMVPIDLQLSNGGDKTFAAMSRPGQDMRWRWETDLPEPTLDGSTATYIDAVDGGDLVVTATPTGFTHFVVLNERPDGPVEFTIPVQTDGGELVEGAGGQLSITDPAGDKTVVQAPAPLMWDSSDDLDGQVGAESEPVETTLGSTSAGTPTITLAPDEEFLAAPETEYPVTIDPAFSFMNHTSGDTWISEAFPSSHHNAVDLRVGTKTANGSKARSYVRFNDVVSTAWSLAPFGYSVDSARLYLHNFESNSCASSPIRVNAIAEAWTLSSLTWANKPSVHANPYDSYVGAKGGLTGNCAAGEAVWVVTGIVNDWGSGQQGEPRLPNQG